MSILEANETPVRTSNGFGINNIKLKDISIPQNVKKFENVIIEKNNNIEITDEVSDVNLIYGNGKVLQKSVVENANNKLKIISNKADKIKIKYEFDNENLDLINILEIKANKNLDVIIEYMSNTDKKCFHNGIIRVFTENNANVNITIVNLLNNISENFEAIENQMKNNSKLNYTIVDLGAQISISNYYTNAFGDNAKNDLKTIYLGKDNEIKDINYIVDLQGKNTFVDIDVQGALDGNSKKHFKGTINFKKGSKKAKGNENEYCMLLSPNAKSLALPMLLCSEDDVEGNHSTASGKIEKEKLFYIMSRGLSYKDAIKLIVKSRFNVVLSRIKDEELKQEVLKQIDRRLD